MKGANMEISTGKLYFVSDSFFAKINDPFLKVDYEHTKRPHYLAFKDSITSLLWLVPCSSKTEKYERIIAQKKSAHKPVDTLKIVVIQDKKTVLLFQDMFPVIDKYIDSPYVKGGQPVYIANPKVVAELEKTAKKVMNLLRRGIKFTPTQPDICRIESLMLEELRKA